MESSSTRKRNILEFDEDGEGGKNERQINIGDRDREIYKYG